MPRSKRRPEVETAAHMQGMTGELQAKACHRWYHKCCKMPIISLRCDFWRVVNQWSDTISTLGPISAFTVSSERRNYHAGSKIASKSPENLNCFISDWFTAMHVSRYTSRSCIHRASPVSFDMASKAPLTHFDLNKISFFFTKELSKNLSEGAEFDLASLQPADMNSSPLLDALQMPRHEQSVSKELIVDRALQIVNVERLPGPLRIQAMKNWLDHVQQLGEGLADQTVQLSLLLVSSMRAHASVRPSQLEIIRACQQAFPDFPVVLSPYKSLRRKRRRSTWYWFCHS